MNDKWDCVEGRDGRYFVSAITPHGKLPICTCLDGDVADLICREHNVMVALRDLQREASDK